MASAYRLRMVGVAFVALTMLAIVKPPNAQDHTRLALTEAIVRDDSVEIDPWRKRQADFARYGHHWYTDKAPGLSIFAVPAVAVSNAAPGAEPWYGPWRRWAMRVFVNGPFLLGLCVLLGAVAEGLAPATGPAVAVATGAGTLLGPLSGVLFSHVAAAFFLAAAFVLAWRRRYVYAGLAAGLAVLFDYPAAIGGALIGLYVVGREWRGIARYALGVIPAVLVLAFYDTVAFGSPFHLSYRYVANGYAELQKGGFFGVSIPNERALHSVLVGGSGFRPGLGLLVTSPIIVAGAGGLILLWRRGNRLEAATCAAISSAYVIWDAGYFAPYGGQSPGPRFAAPAIPFLLIGLAPVLERFRVAALALLGVSITMSTLMALAWGTSNGLIPSVLPATVWSLAGATRPAGAVLCGACAAGAAAVGAASLLWPTRLLSVSREAS